MLGYESLPDSGSGAGPQRSVEGWVVFVTGIYEETQVLRSYMLFVVLLQRDFCRSMGRARNRLTLCSG